MDLEAIHGFTYNAANGALPLSLERKELEIVRSSKEISDLLSNKNFLQGRICSKSQIDKLLISNFQTKFQCTEDYAFLKIAQLYRY